MSSNLSVLMVQTVTLFLLRNRLVDSQDNAVQPGVCTTSGCYDAAKRLLECIDINEDPCQNPYQYVCGNWLKNHPIHQSVKVMGQFSGVYQQLKWQMKHAFKKSNHVPGKSQTIIFLKHMYDNCMNTTKRNAAGSAPIRTLFTSINQLLNSSQINRRSELTGIANLSFRFLGRNGLIVSHFSEHYHMLQQIKKSRLIVADYEFYLKDVHHQDKIVAYKSTLFAYFLLAFPTQFAAVDERTKLHHLIESIYQFEKNLAEIQYQSKDEYFTTVNMKHLQRIFPNIDWWQYFNGVFLANVSTLLYRDRQSFDSALISIYPQYMQSLSNLLSRSSNDLVFAWVSASIIHRFAPFLDDNFKSYYQNLQSRIDVIQYDEDQQDTCFKQLKQAMPVAVQALYAKTYVEERVVKDVESMFPNFLHAFHDTIHQSSWPDNLTRHNLIQKSNNMTMTVGAQSVHLDDIELDSYHKNTDLTVCGEYMDMIVAALLGEMFRWDYSLAEYISSNFTKYNFVENPLAESSYYNPMDNRIVIPALLLQHPLYKYDWPTHVKYSILGSMIGHEFIHGFDSIERLQRLISNSSTDTFNAKVDCFIQAYSNIPLKQPHMRVNGEKTKRDNIADVEGLRLSMKAYNIYANKTGRVADALPDLNLTIDQSNIVGSLVSMCAYESSWHVADLIRDGVHAPFSVRILGALSNTEAFFNAFACPVDSAVNPASACKIW